MAPDYGLLLLIVLALMILDGAAVLVVLITKRLSRRGYRVRSARMKRVNRLLLDGNVDGLRRECAVDPWPFLAHVRALSENAAPTAAIDAVVARVIAALDVEALSRRRLRSPWLHHRIEAYFALGLSREPGAQRLLLAALRVEKRSLGRLVALGRLARHAAPLEFADIVACIEAGRQRNQRSEIMSLARIAPELKAHFDEHGLPDTEVGVRLFLMSVLFCPADTDWDYLESLATLREDFLAEEAVEALARNFPPLRFLAAFGARTEKRFRIPCARLLGQTLTPVALSELDPWFMDPGLRRAGIAAAGDVLGHYPGSEDAFLALIGAGAPERSACLSLAIEHRLPYLLYHASAPLSPGLRQMILRLLDENRSGIILECLLTRLPDGVRAAFHAFIRPELASRTVVAQSLAAHLPEDLRAELGLVKARVEEDRARIPVSLSDKLFIGGLSLVGIAFFPAVFAALRAAELFRMAPAEILYRFIFDFQYLFAYYTLAINAIYLVVLTLSMVKVLSQDRLWRCNLVGSLSGPGILPSVSIIMPAHNEEKSIVESLHSMFSLAYPSFEVIVVNDGSTDDTLGALVRGFGLTPWETGGGGALPSAPVRTIYRSAAMPNLLVIDKANGGKADALNAGLNRATGAFICTIDADSLLDRQSLMRAMFQVVASDRDVIAIGGNVFPVNGCVVEHGSIQEIGLPRAPLARFQTIEYLRSFVGGRLGWTLIDGLLIISGAFGLFRRTAVLEAGGYLAGRGRYRNETVGEDMEIVVRMRRADRDAGRRGRVEYAYNANCWTEVPEEPKGLNRQRDRWHKGLIEVLSFHRGMAFRPRYGAAGMVTLPYFYLFELIGPWMEVMGYAVLAIALLANLLDPVVPLTVFAIAIFFGILISITSILFAERQILYFRDREFLALLVVAVAENFGFRQLTSMRRVAATVKYFFRPTGWGAQTRVGFTTGGGR
jgi:peptidoglycan-N-acetylglucosamine deacetylase